MKARARLTDQLASTARPYHHMLHVKWDGCVRNKPSLIRYLIQTYHYVVASVPLMHFSLASGHVHHDSSYRNYLEQHIVDEQGHEIWLLEDLQKLGIQPEEVRRSLPLIPTMHMVGLAYYTIAHQDPIGLLGYIYALESAPPTEKFLSQLALRCGVSMDCVNTLRMHGLHDLAHRDELFSLIDTYPFNEWQRELLSRTTVSTLLTAIDLFCHLQQSEAGLLQR